MFALSNTQPTVCSCSVQAPQERSFRFMFFVAELLKLFSGHNYSVISLYVGNLRNLLQKRDNKARLELRGFMLPKYDFFFAELIHVLYIDFS